MLEKEFPDRPLTRVASRADVEGEICMKRMFSMAAWGLLVLGWIGCNSSSSPPLVQPEKSVESADSTSEPSTSSESTESSTGGSAEASIPATPPAVASEPMPGYVLIAPLRSTETYLVNADKQVVHRWKSQYAPAASVYLLPNGDLLRTARDPEFKHFHGGGIGGMVERFSWDGELIWKYRYADEHHCAHHDIAMLPNGHLLMIAWERKTKEEAIAQGRDPKLLKDDLWPDHIIEVAPEGSEGGKIVWEWHMWDHLVQDFDREKPNYGVVYEHPELIDLNNTGSTPPSTPEELRKLRSLGYTGGGNPNDDKEDDQRTRADWLHTNAINYNPDLDQIALSAKHFSEIWIIDHSTTKEEAASHRGGKSGKGGDLLYRWGNPWAYKSGTAEQKKLFDQHDVRWISKGLPGAGNITAFNNGQGREYSSIIEITPPLEADGNYTLNDNGLYGPENLTWEYTAENKKEFYSSFISGATRLANGNTFICEGATGRFFEVNRDGKILWQFINPFGGEMDQDAHVNDPKLAAEKLLKEEKKSFVENNALFRATKLPTDYPAFSGKTLTPLTEQPVPFSTLVEAELNRLKAEKAEGPASGETAVPDAATEAAPASTDASSSGEPASEAKADGEAIEPAAAEASPASDNSVSNPGSN